MARTTNQTNNSKGKRTSRVGGKRKGNPIRSNRPNYRKKVLGRKILTNKFHRTGNKIKSKEWEAVKWKPT